VCFDSFFISYKLKKIIANIQNIIAIAIPPRGKSRLIMAAPFQLGEQVEKKCDLIFREKFLDLLKFG
jgi:hypothetical protein